MKLFSNAKQIYMDPTFLKSPKGFYQTLNIICYCEEAKSTIPVFHIPMTSKNHHPWLPFRVVIQFSW